MILFGASGHAKVIVDILIQAGQKVDYLVDARPIDGGLLGYEVLLEADFKPDQGKEIIISIGSNKIRKVVANKLQSSYGKAIHPSTQVAMDVTIEEGTVVMAGAVINSSTHIGKHCIVNTSASIDHDCNIGDYVHISPNATLCGTIAVGEGTHIGAGATIIPNKKIGKWATIGAGTVIIEDIPDYAVVVGSPGRIIKYNER